MSGLAAAKVLPLLTDSAWFGPFIGGASFRPLRAIVSAFLGVVPVDEADQALIRSITGRRTCPTAPARELHLVKGRRAGGSLLMALLGLLHAAFRRFDAYLAPGEVATVMILAADRKQARTIQRYVVGFIDAIPALGAMEVERTKESVTLSNRCAIEIHTASYKSVRGYSVAAVLADEIAYWNVDSEAANPDIEIINALRPALLSIPGSPLVTGSSPRARRGFLWDVFKKHHGQDGDDVLVVHADTLTLNPTANKTLIERAYREDPAAAGAEYGAQFRSDLEQYVTVEVLDRVTMPDRHELPPMPGVTYRAFVDPSGGSSDSMTLAIAHEAQKRTVLDAVREVRAPFDPAAVVTDFATTLKAYRVREVRGDAYGGEWPASRFREHGITYRLADKPKSTLYAEFLPALTTGSVELLTHDRLRHQLLNLERRQTRTGRDVIDHPPRLKDDVANCVAGVTVAGQPTGGGALFMDVAGL